MSNKVKLFTSHNYEILQTEVDTFIEGKELVNATSSIAITDRSTRFVVTVVYKEVSKTTGEPLVKATPIPSKGKVKENE